MSAFTTPYTTRPASMAETNWTYTEAVRLLRRMNWLMRPDTKP